MRFLKLTDLEAENDIVHVWIEDSCDPTLVKQIVLLLRKWTTGVYEITDRRYVKAEGSTQERKEKE